MANRDRKPQPAGGSAHLSRNADAFARSVYEARSCDDCEQPTLRRCLEPTRQPYCTVIDWMTTGVVGTASWAPCRRV